MAYEHDELLLHEIQKRNRERAYEGICAELRLPESHAKTLKEDFERLLVALRYEVKAQIGTILAERFEFDAFDMPIQEFARAVGMLVNNHRFTEGSADARRSVSVMLGALAAGAKVAAEDPAEGQALRDAFGGVAEEIASESRYPTGARDP